MISPEFFFPWLFYAFLGRFIPGLHCFDILSSAWNLWFMEPRRIWQNSDHLSCKKNDGHGKGYPVSQSTNLGRWSVCARLWHVCYSLWSTVTSHRSFDRTRLADLHKNRSWTYVFLLVSPDLVIKIRVWGVADIGHLVRVIANLVINKYYRHLNLKTEYRKSTSQSSHFPKQNGSLDLFGPINIRVLSPVYSHEHSGSFFHNYLTIMSEKKPIGIPWYERWTTHPPITGRSITEAKMARHGIVETADAEELEWLGRSNAGTDMKTMES